MKLRPQFLACALLAVAVAPALAQSNPAARYANGEGSYNWKALARDGMKTLEAKQFSAPELDRFLKSAWGGWDRMLGTDPMLAEERLRPQILRLERERDILRDPKAFAETNVRKSGNLSDVKALLNQSGIALTDVQLRALLTATSAAARNMAHNGPKHADALEVGRRIHLLLAERAKAAGTPYDRLANYRTVEGNIDWNRVSDRLRTDPVFRHRETVRTLYENAVNDARGNVAGLRGLAEAGALQTRGEIGNAAYLRKVGFHFTELDGTFLTERARIASVIYRDSGGAINWEAIEKAPANERAALREAAWLEAYKGLNRLEWLNNVTRVHTDADRVKLRAALHRDVVELNKSKPVESLAMLENWSEIVQRGQSIGVAIKQGDRLSRYRRVDGTVDWKAAGRARVMPHVAGMTQFGLAIFLKEVAMVARTGDAARIEEFFDFVASTDFLKTYGLFTLGAHAADVAYAKYLERFVKPRFVSGMLRTQLVLAAGLGLSMAGDWDTKVFAINVAALGLSSAAVKTGVSSVRWVHNLRSAKATSTLARAGVAASRFVKVGGFAYAVAETAVVLIIADDLARFIEEELDEREARKTLAEAGEAFRAAVADPEADAASIGAASDDLHTAWNDYRDFLYRPVFQEELLFAARLEKLARDAKVSADRRSVTVERLKKSPNLAKNITGRYGSLEAYAEHLNKENDAELGAKIEDAAKRFEANRRGHLAEIYTEEDTGPMLAGVEGLESAFGGPGAYGDRTDGYASHGRSADLRALRRALANPPEGRLGTYGAEAELLEAAKAALLSRGEDDLATALDSTLGLVSSNESKDRAIGKMAKKGLSGALRAE
jgi:hypothetical protein